MSNLFPRFWNRLLNRLTRHPLKTALDALRNAETQPEPADSLATITIVEGEARVGARRASKNVRMSHHSTESPCHRVPRRRDTLKTALDALRNAETQIADELAHYPMKERHVPPEETLNNSIEQSMNTRFQIQFTSDKELPPVSPVIYSHGGNNDAPSVLCRLRDQMEAVCGRGDELSFVAARCVQQLVVDDLGATGVRIRNASRELTIQDRIDGADVFVVEIGRRWLVRQIYGFDEDTKYPSHPKIDWIHEGPAPDLSRTP